MNAFFFRIRIIYFDAIAWQTISKFTNFAGEVIQHKEALDQKHEEQKYDENEVNGNLPSLQIFQLFVYFF